MKLHEDVNEHGTIEMRSLIAFQNPSRSVRRAIRVPGTLLNAFIGQRVITLFRTFNTHGSRG